MNKSHSRETDCCLFVRAHTSVHFRADVVVNIKLVIWVDNQNWSRLYFTVLCQLSNRTHYSMVFVCNKWKSSIWAEHQCRRMAINYHRTTTKTTTRQKRAFKIHKFGFLSSFLDFVDLFTVCQSKIYSNFLNPHLPPYLNWYGAVSRATDCSLNSNKFLLIFLFFGWLIEIDDRLSLCLWF